MQQCRQIVKTALMLGLCIAFTACKSGLYGRRAYVDEPVSGAINGQEWQIAYAYTDPFLDPPDGMTHYIVLVASTATRDCPKNENNLESASSVMFSLDGKKGEMTLARKRLANDEFDDAEVAATARSTTLAFIYDNKGKQESLLAEQGRIKIDKIGKKFISGRLYAQVNERNYVNGKFKAKVCSAPERNPFQERRRTGRAH